MSDSNKYFNANKHNKWIKRDVLFDFCFIFSSFCSETANVKMESFFLSRYLIPTSNQTWRWNWEIIQDAFMQWLHHEHIVCACVCLAFKINGSIAIETAIAIAKAYRADRFSAIFSEKKNAREKRCKQSTWKSAICNEKSSYRLAASASNYLRYEFSYRYRHSDTVSIVSETKTEREREHRLRKTQPKHTEYQKQSFLQPRQQTPKCKRARPEMSAFNRTIHDYYYAVCIDVLPSLTGLKNMKM